MSSHLYSTASLFPAFAGGWIVIDACDAPNLTNAIGSRIFKSQRGAEAARDKARRFLRAPDVGERIHAVPVDGPNGIFALDFIGADGVTVRPNGEIRIRLAR